MIHWRRRRDADRAPRSRIAIKCHIAAAAAVSLDLIGIVGGLAAHLLALLLVSLAMFAEFLRRNPA